MDSDIIFESDADECSDNSFKHKMEAMEIEIASLEGEVKIKRGKYYEMLLENVKKDFEIDELEKNIQQEKNKTVYADFAKYFSSNWMNTLRSFDRTENEDSKFILSAVRGLYENSLEVLKSKNISGRSKDNSKQPVTPEKIGILRDLLKERVANDQDSAEREKKLNNLIKTSIETINKKQF